MEVLLDKWPALLSMIIYLALFFPALVMNIIIIISIIYIIVTSILLRVLPTKYISRLLHFLSSEKTRNLIGKVSFRVGKFSIDFRDDISEIIPFVIPKKLVLYPLQKTILDTNKEVFNQLTEGFLEGLRYDPNDINRNESNNDIYKIHSYANWIKYIYKVIIGALILLTVFLPLILFIVIVLIII